MNQDKNDLIYFNEDKTRVTYNLCDITRNYDHPEENVQAEAYCQLIKIYGYSPKRIKMNVSVTTAKKRIEIDIIVYKDDDCLEPYILVDCK